MRPAEISLRAGWIMHTFRSRQHTIDLSLVFIVVAMLAAAPCSPGYAQQQVATRFQYAAKALCTLAGDVGFGDAFQPGEAPGSFTITPYKSLTLESDQAVAYNCFDISSFYCPIHGVCVHFTAIDGFLVVNSPVELDVVAVYTAHPKAGEVSTLDTGTITGRRMPKTIIIKPDEPLAQPEKRIEMEPFKPVKP